MDIKELRSFKLSDAVKFHDRLNPKLFKNEKLDPEVRKQLLIIAQDFMQELGVSGLNVEDITLSGSNAAYTYTKHSDADLHILIDMSKLPEDEVYRELFNSKKNLYNDSHDITVHGIPVELYVQDTNEPVKSLGEYSVLNDKWINIPKKRRATLDITNTRLKFQKLIEIIEIAIKSQDVEKINTLLGLIRRYRQAGLDKGGEFSPENLAFKALRSQGMIDKLRNVKNKLHSKDLSIENVNESRPELKFLRPGELRGSYTDAQLKAMGFKQAQNGSWYILKEQLVKNKSISEEEKLAERLSKEFEDYDPNGPPPGPEFKPTMPAGTVKVDVSDVYDWYKLGQHISNLKGLGKHDFGKGPPSTILSFGDEDTEHQYISDLEKTGLATTDIDPIDPNRPKGMKRQKVDPTYNVGPLKENEELFEVNFNDPKIINDALNADIRCGFEAETVWYQSPVMRDPWEDITDWDELNNVIDSRQERKAFALYDQWMYEHPSFDKYLDRIRNEEINKYIDDDETKIEFFDELFPDRTKLSDEDKIDEIDNSRQLTQDYREWIADTYVYEELDIQEEAISIFKKKFSMDDFINDVYEGSYSDFAENELGFYFDTDLLSRDDTESMSIVAADLSPWINSSSRFKEYRSGTYHISTDPTKWRIETDSSIEPNDPDEQVGAEIISPVYDTPNEMLSEMDSLFKYFRNNNVTTNDTTGLHVTMSYPQATESPNQLKMAVLLGDPYLLKVFDRLENTYTQSQYKRLKDAASFLDNPNNLREVERLLMPAVGVAKYSSIHFKSNGHVEFRIAGNEDYEKRMPEIRKTVARYAIIMMAGYDSTFLMKDYYTALGRLVRSTFKSGPGDVLQNNFINVYNKLQRSVINKIETDEYPIFMNLKTATPLDKAKAKGVFVDLIDKLSSQNSNKLPAVSDMDSRIIRTTARDLGYTSIDQIIDDMVIPDYRKEDTYDNLDKIFKTKVKREPVTTSTEGFFEAKKTDYFTGSEYSNDKYNWKVEDVLALAKSDPKYFHKDFPLSKLKHDLEWWQGNEERMMNADTSYPLLVIQNNDGHLTVADGLNRMKKAISVEKKKTIDVYIVPEEDTMHLAFENRVTESVLNEFVAYHGTFRPRLQRFFRLSHFGTERAATDRLYDAKAMNPKFANATKGYVYELDLGITAPGKVKDYPDIVDPGSASMQKIAAWSKDLMKDPRFANYTGVNPINNRPDWNGKDILKHFANLAQGPYWSEIPYTKFIFMWINFLQAVGIDGLVYFNQVEHRRSKSYVIFHPDQVRVLGKPKVIDLSKKDQPQSKVKKFSVYKTPMINSSEEITESLDQPYPMKWSRGEFGDWEVLARLPDDTKLEILFSRMSNTNNSPIELIFLRGDSMELTGEGDAQRVFATVLAAIQQFLKKAQPDTLIFSASKQVEPGQSIKSRSKLYDRLVQRYAAASGYESHQEDHSDHVKYRLTKKENVTEAKKSITLGPQLYVPRKKSLQESLKPNAELWTSTAKVGSNGYTSEWVEWCKQEMPHWVTDEGTLYDVAPGARILNISTDKDVMRIAKKYGIEVKDSMELFMKMRWEMLAKDYDAIHHTLPSNRYDNLFMSAWDVESTAWFNTKFLVNPRKVKVDSGVTELD